MTADNAWLLLSPESVPDGWRDRAIPMSLVPLLPSESADLLVGRASPSALTAQQEELAKLIAQGLPKVAIARRLGVSVRTVERRTAALCAVVGSSTVSQLATRLAQLGLARD